MKAEAQQCSVTVPGTPGFRSHAAPGSSFCPGSHDSYEEDSSGVCSTSLIWGLSAVFSSSWTGVVGFWKEDPRSEVALLSHHIRAADVCTTSWGPSAWSPGSGGVCQGELLLSCSPVSLAATQGEAAHPARGGS